MNSSMILWIFIPALFLIFIFTKASLTQFLLGFGLCLFGQVIFLVCYCIFKIQNALLDSTRIKLEQNYTLHAQKQYPFKQRKQIQKPFLNKYTQQQKLETKKNTLKVQSFNNYLSEQQILSEQPKRQMLDYLNQKKQQHQLYNAFNKLLIQFGQSLQQLSIYDSSYIPLSKKKYQFVLYEQTCESQIGQDQLQNFERQILNHLQIKLRIQSKQNHILFPNWLHLLNAFNNIGKQFYRIKQMHSSNQEIINMLNDNIIDDFQFIQSEIKKSLKSLDNIQRTSQSLKKQNQDFLTAQRNLKQNQIDLMFLLKQQYYKFQDFQLRMKQNQNNHRYQTKQLSYYRQKLNTFYRNNRQYYQKIFKTRFFAILDSYNITLQQSLNTLIKVLSLNHQFSLVKPPKVNKLECFKNMNQQIQAEKYYQLQYFQRATYYNNKLSHLINNLKDLQTFLSKFQHTLTNLFLGLKNSSKHIRSNPQSSKSFSLGFVIKFYQSIQKLLFQVRNLHSIHSKFSYLNESYLQISHNRTQSTILQAQTILSQVLNPKQSIQYKYKLIKLSLQQKYSTIQNEIQEIKRFQNIYKRHSSRIKKTLIMEFLHFFVLEKMYMNESDFIRKSFQNSLNYNQIINKIDKQEQKQQHNLEQTHTLDNIYTGQYLSQEFVNLINRFLFSAYSEWKNSQFFKQTISKQIYILLNKDQNQNLAQVVIQSLQLTGSPPQILMVRELHSQCFEFLADLSIAFKGKLILNLKTQYKFMGINFPTEVRVQLEQLYCVIRACFVNTQHGQSWFSYIGEPIAKVTLVPKIYNISIGAETIRNFFSNLILKKLKENTFPVREKILIPVSKEDLMWEQIQRRFKFPTSF